MSLSKVEIIKLTDLSKKTDDELIQCFNSQVWNNGSWYAKMLRIWAIREEFMERNFDFSLIINENNGLSYAKKIKLSQNNKIVFES
jgi:hypothetical protein